MISLKILLSLLNPHVISSLRSGAARRPRENLRRRSNLYIHGRDEEVKNDYRERTYAKDVQSTAGGDPRFRERDNRGVESGRIAGWASRPSSQRMY